MHLKHTCFAINLKFQKGKFIHLAQQEVHVHRSGWTPSNSHAPTNATCIGYVYKTMSFVCGSDFPLFFFLIDITVHRHEELRRIGIIWNTSSSEKRSNFRNLSSETGNKNLSWGTLALFWARFLLVQTMMYAERNKCHIKTWKSFIYQIAKKLKDTYMYCRGREKQGQYFKEFLF